MEIEMPHTFLSMHPTPPSLMDGGFDCIRKEFEIQEQERLQMWARDSDLLSKNYAATSVDPGLDVNHGDVIIDHSHQTALVDYNGSEIDALEICVSNSIPVHKVETPEGKSTDKIIPSSGEVSPHLVVMLNLEESPPKETNTLDDITQQQGQAGQTFSKQAVVRKRSRPNGRRNKENEIPLPVMEGRGAKMTKVNGSPTTKSRYSCRRLSSFTNSKNSPEVCEVKSWDVTELSQQSKLFIGMFAMKLQYTHQVYQNLT